MAFFVNFFSGDSSARKNMTCSNEVLLLLLQEGVAKCKSIGQKNIAWREILEFGGDRFWRGRTPMDLKDKWRNICKGSPNKR